MKSSASSAIKHKLSCYVAFVILVTNSTTITIKLWYSWKQFLLCLMILLSVFEKSSISQFLYCLWKYYPVKLLQPPKTKTNHHLFVQKINTGISIIQILFYSLPILPINGHDLGPQYTPSSSHPVRKQKEHEVWWQTPASSQQPCTLWLYGVCAGLRGLHPWSALVGSGGRRQEARQAGIWRWPATV